MNKSSTQLLFERMHSIGGMPLNDDKILNESEIPMVEAGKANKFKINIGNDSFTLTGDYIQILGDVFEKAKQKIRSSEMTIKDISIRPIGFANTNEGESSIEDVANAADDVHDYEEAPSYQIKLDKIADCATDLHEKFKHLDNLPAWVQDKITIAEHNMVAIHDWLESKAHKNKYHQDDVEEMGLDESKRMDEENEPNDPQKWNYAKSQAKEKFDVYPSAYANAWASKKYKELGGTWKKKK